MDNVDNMNKTWQAYNNFKSIEADLVTLLRYVELNEDNYRTYSAEIKKLILASCSFIETNYFFLLDEFNIVHKNDKEESIASKIYKMTLEKNCPLTNLTPSIQNQIFSPWLPTKVKDKNMYKFRWWDAYNTCKHPDHSKDLKIEYFKSAVESVAALFSITVLLTSQSAINIFWHSSDFVKIQTARFKPLSIYNNTSKQLKKQIWPDHVT